MDVKDVMDVMDVMDMNVNCFILKLIEIKFEFFRSFTSVHLLFLLFYPPSSLHPPGP